MVTDKVWFFKMTVAQNPNESLSPKICFIRRQIVGVEYLSTLIFKVTLTIIFVGKPKRKNNKYIKLNTFMKFKIYLHI